jgi:hypothetical protein
MFGAIIECLVFELTACALYFLQAQDTGAVIIVRSKTRTLRMAAHVVSTRKDSLLARPYPNMRSARRHPTTWWRVVWVTGDGRRDQRLQKTQSSLAGTEQQQ